MKTFGELEYSDWHNGDLFNPPQPGVYQLRHKGEQVTHFRYWNGYTWFWIGFSPNEAFRHHQYQKIALKGVAASAGCEFRGLKEEYAKSS